VCVLCVRACTWSCVCICARMHVHVCYEIRIHGLYAYQMKAYINMTYTGKWGYYFSLGIIERLCNIPSKNYLTLFILEQTSVVIFHFKTCHINNMAWYVCGVVWCVCTPAQSVTTYHCVIEENIELCIFLYGKEISHLLLCSRLLRRRATITINDIHALLSHSRSKGDHSSCTAR
jgi:hypothetical protein